MAPQGDDRFKRVLEREWLRDARQLVVLRALGVTGWAAIAAVFVAFVPREPFPEWSAQLPWLIPYAVLAWASVALFWLRPNLFRHVAVKGKAAPVVTWVPERAA